MLLFDTSIWIAHFRNFHTELAEALSQGTVLMHPFISGELTCGNLKDRKAILSDLDTLPRATLASNPEVLHLIDTRKLWGKGLGLIDVHLLASALLSHSLFRTLDKKLETAAVDLDLL